MLDLERKVLTFIGEDPDSPDVFADTDEGLYSVRASLSDAVGEISMLSGGSVRTVMIPLVAECTFYRLRLLRDEFAWVRSAWLQGQSRPLEQSDAIVLASESPRWLRESGIPDYYLQIGLDLIGFAPTPSSSSDVAILECVVVPGALESDDDVVQLRREHEWAAMQYAASEYYASRGDANRASDLYGGYLATLGKVAQHIKTADRNYRVGRNDLGSRPQAN